MSPLSLQAIRRGVGGRIGWGIGGHLQRGLGEEGDWNEIIIRPTDKIVDSDRQARSLNWLLEGGWWGGCVLR